MGLAAYVLGRLSASYSPGMSEGAPWLVSDGVGPGEGESLLGFSV
jgi:hypothetical protein